MLVRIRRATAATTAATHNASCDAEGHKGGGPCCLLLEDGRVLVWSLGGHRELECHGPVHFGHGPGALGGHREHTQELMRVVVMSIGERIIAGSIGDVLVATQVV